MQDTVTIDRYKYIGGSDIPIIMGLSPFKTRWQLLKEKAQIEQSDFDGNMYTRYGDTMEPAIRNYVNTAYDCDFVETVAFNGDVRYHADGFYKDTVLEIKTTSKMHDSLLGYKHYLVQLLTGMWANGVDYGILAVYERPENFSTNFDEARLHTYMVKMVEHEELMAEIHASIESFMRDLEYLTKNPFADASELPSGTSLAGIVHRVQIVQNKIIELKQAEDELAELKTKLKQAMEKAKIKSWEYENIKLTLVPEASDKTIYKFNEEKFAKEHEKMHKKYLEEHIQKGRNGYVRVTIRQ